jgi:hypothetical protein
MDWSVVHLGNHHKCDCGRCKECDQKMNHDILKQSFQAATANLADAATTRQNLRNLIQWHEAQKQVHDHAVDTLHKALVSHDQVIASIHEVATETKQLIIARDAAPTPEVQ